MFKTFRDRPTNHLIIFLATIFAVGLILFQLNWQKAKAYMDEKNNRKAPTPTKTATPISFDLGPGKYLERKKAIQTMLARATGSPSINYVCGRLQIVKDTKTDKDILVLEPCIKGSYYVFKVRPDELHSYYQLMNVRLQNGDEVFTKEFGILSKYISNFSGYYVLDSCQGCGIKPVFISTAEIIFPTSTSGGTTQATIYSTLPPFPTQKEIASLSTSTSTVMEPVISPSPLTLSGTPPISPATPQAAETAAPANAIYLSMLDLSIEPAEPVQNQVSQLHITVQNLGFPIAKPDWDYSGKVQARTADGKVLEEWEFAKDRSSSIREVEDPRVQAETWEITIPVRFSQLVQNGELEVSIQSTDYLTYIYPRSIKSSITIHPEAKAATPEALSTSQEILQPTAITTESIPANPINCPGFGAIFMIPVIGLVFHWMKARRKP